MTCIETLQRDGLMNGYWLIKSIAAWAMLLFVTIAIPQAMAATTVLPGVWLMGTKVAIQVFDCNDKLCGRVIWLRVPLDPQGLLKRDKLNPDPALRDR